MVRLYNHLPIISTTMILYIVLAIVLWFVVPLFVDGHVKNKNDRKAWRLLSRIIAVLMLVLMIYHEFL